MPQLMITISLSASMPEQSDWQIFHELQWFRGLSLPMDGRLCAGWNKESMAELMAEYAASGYLTAAIDCRYHGARALPEGCLADPRNAYQDALCR